MLDTLQVQLTYPKWIDLKPLDSGKRNSSWNRPHVSVRLLMVGVVAVMRRVILVPSWQPAGGQTEKVVGQPTGKERDF